MDEKKIQIPELLTPKEAAAALRTTVGHLANTRCRGDGPPICKVGGRVFFPAKELAAYISNRIKTPGRATR